MGRIFSSDKPFKSKYYGRNKGAHIPHGSSKRAKRKGLDKILDTDNIDNLSLEDRRDLRSYLRENQKKIKEMINSSDSTNPITQNAQEDNLANIKFSENPTELFKELQRQREFFDEYEEYIQDRKDVEDYGYDGVESLMEDADKWNILRRLAQVDQRLNIDRAYASMVLHDIEDMIESRQYSMTYQELADELIEDYLHTHSKNDAWNESLHSFSDEDIIISANKGFHGKDKAYEAWNRRYNKARRSTDINNYEASYDRPLEMRDIE